MGSLFGLIISFLMGGVRALFPAKAAPAPDTAGEAQQRAAPAMAATAGRDEQALADQTTTVTAERKSDEDASRDTAAVGDAQRRSVRESDAQLQADPDLPFRD